MSIASAHIMPSLTGRDLERETPARGQRIDSRRIGHQTTRWEQTQPRRPTTVARRPYHDHVSHNRADRPRHHQHHTTSYVDRRDRRQSMRERDVTRHHGYRHDRHRIPHAPLTQERTRPYAQPHHHQHHQEHRHQDHRSRHCHREARPLLSKRVRFREKDLVRVAGARNKDWRRWHERRIAEQERRRSGGSMRELEFRFEGLLRRDRYRTIAGARARTPFGSLKLRGAW